VPSTRLIIIVIALAVAACTQTTPSVTTQGASSPEATSQDAATPDTSPDDISTSTAPEGTGGTVVMSEECASDEAPFTDDGAIGSGGAARSDAAVIEGLTWEILEGCERFIISFATPEGAPAVAAPTVGAEFIRHAGIVRIEFSSTVAATAIFDQVVDSELIDRVFVFSTVTGSIVADIHLAAPAFARVLTETAPASVMVDLMPGGTDYAAPPVIADGVVLIGPDPALAGYPITITGYADPSAPDRLSASLETPDGSIITSEAALAETDGEWGGFAVVFPDGPSGDATISIDDGPSIELVIP
jgi:hypothetical protein